MAIAGLWFDVGTREDTTPIITDVLFTWLWFDVGTREDTTLATK